jgi:basic membrane lipoprotein Med (substrate-binding protein (PBP1-ABC) superfamily)
VKDGSFRPRVITLGMREDVVTWVPNPTLASRVPAAVQARVDSVRRLMMSGAFSAEGK